MTTPTHLQFRMTLAATFLLIAPAHAVVDFTFTSTKAIEVGSVGLEYFLVDCVVTNTGTEPDEYDVLRRGQDVPTGWATVPPVRLSVMRWPDGLAVERTVNVA